MKSKILTLFMMLLSLSNYAQVTTYFYGRDKVQSKNETAALYSVSIYENNTRVTIELIPTKNRSRMNYWTSRNTYIIVGDNMELPIIGFERTVNGETVVDTNPFTGDWGWSNVKKDQKYYYTIIFSGKIPPGITNFTLKDKGTYSGAHGYGFSNYTLNNPRTGATSWNEFSVKQNIETNNDGICGIYEGSDEQGYKLGCIKDNEGYHLIYLGSKEQMSWWQIGDTKAILRPSATSGFFKAEWYMADKTSNNDCYVVFDGGSMKIIIDKEETFYLKMFPTASTNGQISSGVEKWSGTGFALNNGYIATNYHVINNAKSIKVQGIRGSFATKYNATVVSTDRYNDLAIIKINDSRFNGFGTIPYRIKTSISETGENIFVLGYPLTTALGDEIKLTTGVISSKTGFQGDASLYQISAPIQPGNSGGPLFDRNGNLIGIVNAKLNGAENVGYAIKASYLDNLADNTSLMPQNNTIYKMPLSNKVKSLKNFVFMITCSSSSDSPISSNEGVSHNSMSSSEVTYNNPVVSKQYDNSLTLISVMVKSYETVLTISCKNNLSGGWMNINKNAYIVANGTKYTLTGTEGIAYSPNYTYFSYQGESKIFKLHFHAIPKNTNSIDFIEDTNSQWRLYGIKLR
ncbi:MAG: trypsin-like peptidase domain-containing protein [Prevotella salivae]|uniref:S1C family serine protease n=1 Tax=Segatella salivae TaxID=228604 RepID=UPI001CB1FD00|nr:serine protease [Segatella salivae]MBF1545110.1 trypsin-like peptidase domain-containing protein [Segatella salivae]